MTKNHRNIQSRFLGPEFSFTDIFNDINYGYKAAPSTKKCLKDFSFKSSENLMPSILYGLFFQIPKCNLSLECNVIWNILCFILKQIDIDISCSR